MNKFNRLLAATVVLSTVVAPGAASADTTNVSTSAVTANATGNFADLGSAGSWAKDAIVQAKNLGLMKGDPDGNFRPLGTLTRQELAVILTNAMKLDASTAVTTDFSDVTASTWGSHYIAAVQKAGLMSGDGDGHFRPNDPVTREELAVVLAKALNLPVNGQGNNLAVADRNAISSWAKDAVQAVIEEGLMKGDGVNFNPKSNATRQEIAVVAVQFVKALEKAQIASVDSVADGSVTIQGVTYQVADSLTGILNAKNAEVLKGSKIKFVTDNGTINQITYLEVTNSGQAAAAGSPEFSGDLVLDGGNSTISGDLKISADYITVNNLNVTGNLVIGSELQNDFYSSNLKVSGQTEVDGGAPNTVVFDNDSLGDMQVNKQNVRVKPEGSTTVGNVTVSSNATITADAGVTIPQLTVLDGADSVEINATVTTVNVQGGQNTTIGGSGSLGTVTVSGGGNVSLSTTGTIGSVQVTNSNTKLTVAPGTKINNLQLPDGVQASDVIQNYDQVKGQITNVNGSQNPDAPAAGGGGSTGGGGGGGPVPTRKPQYLMFAGVTTKDSSDDKPITDGSMTATASSDTVMINGSVSKSTAWFGPWNNYWVTLGIKIPDGITPHLNSDGCYDNINVFTLKNRDGNMEWENSGTYEPVISVNGSQYMQFSFALDSTSTVLDDQGRMQLKVVFGGDYTYEGGPADEIANPDELPTNAQTVYVDYKSALTASTLQAVNNASSEDIRSVLEDNATALGLGIVTGTDSDYANLSDTGKTTVAQIVYSNKPETGYQDAASVKNAFNRAVSEAETTTTYVTSSTDLQSALENVDINKIILADNTNFVGQFEVTRNVELDGEGASTIIQAPSDLKNNGENSSVLAIKGATAKIQNLVIDGQGNGQDGERFAGISFENAGGEVSNVTVKDIKNGASMDGVQEGFGIYANNTDNAPRTLSVTNSNVSGYQKDGMIFKGAGLTVDVSGNTVTGAGVTDVISQNGIELSYGATGSITNNTVTANQSDASLGWSSTGIMAYEAGTGYTINPNKSTGNDNDYYDNTLPDAPNVTADDVNNVLINANTTMEYSTDSGATWKSYVQNHQPTFAGNVTVEVRVAADGKNKASNVTSLTFTTNPSTPTAPTNPVQDDAANTFGWTNVTGFTNASDYEYSVDGGKSWNPVTANPQTGITGDVTAGDVQVRVKADATTGRPSGQVLVSTADYTSTN